MTMHHTLAARTQQHRSTRARSTPHTHAAAAGHCTDAAADAPYQQRPHSTETRHTLGPRSATPTPRAAAGQTTTPGRTPAPAAAPHSSAAGRLPLPAHTPATQPLAQQRPGKGRRSSASTSLLAAGGLRPAVWGCDHSCRAAVHPERLLKHAAGIAAAGPHCHQQVPR